MDNDGNPCVHSGRIASEFFKNGMVVTFDKPCRTIERNDTLAIRTPKGETLEMFPAAVRPDGGVSVWYAAKVSAFSDSSRNSRARHRE